MKKHSPILESFFKKCIHNMDQENFDENNLPSFIFPEAFLEQIFEFTGSTEGNRGFLLVSVNQEGAPTVFAKADNQIIEMGLRKALEKYLLDTEEAEHYNGEEPFRD